MDGVHARVRRGSLLGEELKLPSVATWWCGEQLALDYVLDHLERLVIKPAYPESEFPGGHLRTGSRCPRQRAALAQAASSREPHAYVAQQSAWPSRRRRCGAVARVAASADSRRGRSGSASMPWRLPDGYRVMPGGLARIATDNAADIVSMQRGGGSKDVWVLQPGTASLTDDGRRLPPLRRALRRGTTSCRRGSPRICSGWAVTASAARTRRGWCAPRWACAATT